MNTLSAKVVVLAILVALSANNAANACTNLTPNFTINAPGCGVPRSATLANTSTGSEAATTTYIWKLNGVAVDTTVGTAASGALSMPATGSYNITMLAITAGGCRDSITQGTTVSSGLPQIIDGTGIPTYNPVWQNCIAFISDPDSFRIDISATDTLNSYVIIWDDGAANSSGGTLLPGAMVSHTYAALGNYAVKIVTTKGGCRDTIVGLVSNARQPTAGIIGPPSGLNAGCAPHTIRFINSSYNVSPNTIFRWDFGDGVVEDFPASSFADTIYHTYLTGLCNGVVTLQAINSCGTSTTTWNPININEKDIAVVDVVNPNNCSPTVPFTFLNLSIDRYCLTPDPKLYFWDFGDGTTVGWTNSKASQNHIYADDGFYTIMLIDSNRCGADTTYFNLTVVRPPRAGIAFDTDTIGCVPFTVSVRDTSDGLFRTRTWNFGDPASGANNTSTDSAETHTYNTAGTYNISLTSSNPCGDSTIVKRVVVLPRPTPGFNVTNNGCVPFTASFTNTTTTVSNAATYYWTFGNGDTSTAKTPPNITYNTPGAYTVKMVVYDTCGRDSTTRTVNVYPLPVAYFKTTRVCRGTATAFTDSSYLSASFGSTTINSRKWYFGDGDSSTATNPTHTYANPGTYAVRLLVQTNRGCRDTILDSVTVDPSPTVSFTVSPAQNVCFGTQYSFDGSFSTNFGTITGYEWDFGNGTKGYSEDTVYTYTSPGTYNVTLRVNISNGCFNTATRTLVVSPLPQARITYQAACVGFPVQFRDSGAVSAAGGNSITNRQWDFDNDSIFDATGITTSHTFSVAGYYLIRLRETTNNNCTDEDTLTIYVSPRPVMNLSLLSSNSLCVGDSFYFHNTSTGGASYQWSFGDGNTYAYPDTGIIAYAYSAAGNFTVKLTSLTASGCIDSAKVNIISRPLPDALFTPNDTVRCAPFNFQFTNQSTNADSYRWFINGVPVSTAATLPDTLIPVPGVTLNIRLIAENSYNCRPDTFDQVVRTSFDPVADFTLSPMSGCGPLSVSTQNLSTNSTTYRWIFGNGVTSRAFDTTVVFQPSLSKDTFYTITLIASTGLGCQDTFQRSIQVFPRPDANFSVDNDEGCGPLTVNFTNLSSPLDTGSIDIMTFSWDFDNGVTSHARDTSITFPASLAGDTVYQVRLISQSEHSCPDTIYKDIRVHPLPFASFDLLNADSCGPFQVRTLNQSYSRNTFTIAPLSFQWDFGNGITSTADDTTVLYQAALTRDTTYTIRLVATSEFGCVDSFSRTVTVYAKPEAGISQSDTANCGPLLIQFQSNSRNFSEGGNDTLFTYLWDFGNGNQSVAKNPTQIFAASQTQDSVFQIRLIVTSQHGCTDTVFSSIRTYPSPKSRFIAGPLSGCQPLVVNFTNQSINANAYLWDFGDGDTSTAEHPAHTFRSSALLDTIYYVKLKTTSPNGCSGDSAMIQVRVNPNPRLDFIPSTDTLCPGDAVVLNNASLGATFYEWNIAGQQSFAINPIAAINTLPTQDTTLAIKLKGYTPNGCVDSITKTVTLLAKPRAQFSLTVNTGCTPFSVSINNLSQRADSYEWDFGDGTKDTGLAPAHIYVNPVSATLHYRITLKAFRKGLCTDTFSLPVSIYPLPFTQFDVARPDSCGPFKVRTTNQSYSRNTFTITPLSFQWDFGNGVTSTARDTSVFYAASLTQDTTYSIRLIATSEFGCIDSFRKTITVYPKPKAGIIKNKTADCGPMLVQFSSNSQNFSNGGLDTLFTYEWDFGNGNQSVAKNPTQTFAASQIQDTTYQVRLKVSSQHGCTDTISTTVTVHPNPRSRFTASPLSGCHPLSVSFTNQSVNAASYFWDFGDGDTSSLTHPTHVFSSSSLVDTIFYVKLKTLSIHGCPGDSQIVQIRVNPKPIADFTPNTDTICPGDVIFISNNSQAATSYQWTIAGQTTTAVNPILAINIFPTQDTTLSIRLRALSPQSCSDTITKTITLVAKPRARFSLAGNSGCTPFSVNITNQSLRADSYEWDFGDGHTDTAMSPTHTYSNSASATLNYRIKLKVYRKGLCTDTFSLPVTVYPLPFAMFDVARTDSCGPFQVRTINKSYSKNTFTITPLSFQWDFGNGVKSRAVDTAVFYQAALTRDTSYTIRLVVTSENGCIDSFRRTVTVYAKPRAGILQDKLSGCGPLTVQFSSNSRNFSFSGIDSLLTYSWNFGNGILSTAKNPVQTFAPSETQDTTYPVRLRITSQNGCIDSASTTVTVHPIPKSRFSAGPLAGCQPLTVNFTQLSVNAGSYAWDFGDGDTSTAANPSHTFLNASLVDTIFQVKLKTVSPYGCPGDSMIIQVRVYPDPVADFQPNTDTVCPGDVLFMSNFSVGGTSFQWNIAGTSSTAINPISTVNIYPTQDTTLSIKLRVSTPNSCLDSVTKTVTLVAKPRASFSLAANSGCSPFTVNITNLSERADSYEWDFGDGVTDTGLTPSHTYQNPSPAILNYRIKVRAYRKGLCTDTFSLPVRIFPLPKAQFVSSRVDLCDSGYTQFTSMSLLGSTFFWDFGDGSTSTQENPLHRYNQSYSQDTFYRAFLRVTTVDGCTDTISKVVRVTPNFRVNFSTTPVADCGPVVVSFNNTSENGLYYFWDFGDGTGSNQKNPIHTFNTTGLYNVTLTAYDAFGCSKSITKSNLVEVYETPLATFLPSDFTLKLPLNNINFQNLSNAVNPMTYQWDFDDPSSPSNSSTLRDPSHSYTDSGTYDIRLVVYNGFCYDTAYQRVVIEPHLPIASFDELPDSGCVPLTVQFVNKSQYADSYEWFFGDGQKSTLENPSHTYIFPGEYTVLLLARGPGGMDDTVKSQVIKVFPLPNVRFYAMQTTVFLPDAKFELIPVTPGLVDYLWTVTDNLTGEEVYRSVDKYPVFTLNRPGDFDVTLYAKNEQGCIDSLTVPRYLSTGRDGAVAVPDAFTPNGDGKNDFFKPKMENVLPETYIFRVYNRWGELVYYTQNIKDSWDGTFLGKFCQMDAYVWTIQGKYVNGEIFVQNGVVTLIR